MLVTFPAYGRSASCIFQCKACQKERRKRTFRVEMTVNQVSQEAQAAANLERDEFLVYPLCKSCEDARSWSEMKSIRARRKQVALTSG